MHAHAFYISIQHLFLETNLEFSLNLCKVHKYTLSSKAAASASHKNTNISTMHEFITIFAFYTCNASKAIF